MPELAQSKTKRTYIKRLLGNNFKYQYSIFYQSREDASRAIESGLVLRKAIARKYRDQPFLWRLAKILNEIDRLDDDFPKDTPDRIEMVYWTFFTTNEVKVRDLKALISQVLPISVKVSKRAVTEERLKKMANTIGQQQPHDLNNFFGLKKVNRFHCANIDKFTVI